MRPYGGFFKIPRLGITINRALSVCNAGGLCKLESKVMEALIIRAGLLGCMLHRAVRFGDKFKGFSAGAILDMIMSNPDWVFFIAKNVK